MRIKFAAFLWLAAFSSLVFADGWSGPQKIQELNIGGNGLHGTYVSLESYSFTGCSSAIAFLASDTNLNYKEIYSALLAASVSEKEISVYTSGCGGNNDNHPLILALKYSSEA